MVQQLMFWLGVYMCWLFSVWKCMFRLWVICLQNRKLLKLSGYLIMVLWVLMCCIRLLLQVMQQLLLLLMLSLCRYGVRLGIGWLLVSMMCMFSVCVCVMVFLVWGVSWCDGFSRVLFMLMVISLMVDCLWFMFIVFNLCGVCQFIFLCLVYFFVYVGWDIFGVCVFFIVGWFVDCFFLENFMMYDLLCF